MCNTLQTMSSSYYKKAKSAPPPNSYGFKQVSPKELGDILKRVTRSTYSAKLHTEEQRQLNNYDRVLSENNGRRNIASACSRRTDSRMSSATSDSNGNRPKRLSEREMSRLIRRLQRPTTSTSAQRFPNEELENLKQGKIVRSKSADAHSIAKSMAKLRRPTTATLAKTLNTCHLCYEHENRINPQDTDVFDYDYGEKKAVPAEEVDFIVGRVAAPTYSSCSRTTTCKKLPEYVDEVRIRANLPLLSGLSRSKNVREITERLNPRRQNGHAPQATPITIY